MNNDFNNFDDNEEDFFELNIRKWTATLIERYMDKFQITLTEEEEKELKTEIILEYYPGIANLRDDELVRQKFYPSLETFRYAVSIKRMVEETGLGMVVPLIDGWRFGFGGGL